MVLRWVVALIMVPFMALANSNDTAPAFVSVYGVNPGCAFCHGSNTTIAPTAASPKYGQDYRNAIIGALSTPGFDRNDPNDLVPLVEFLEQSYVPMLSDVNGSADASGVTTLALPGGTGSFAVQFDGGKTNTNAIANLEDLTENVSTSASLAMSISISRVGNNATVTLPTDDAFIRGRTADRGNPYVIQFVPENTSGFSPTTAGNLAENAISLTFTNLVPKGVADNFNQSNTGREGAAWVLDVLANDDDPDAALPSGETNSPPAEIGCVSSSVSQGTLEANSGDTALIYTLPSPLPDTPQSVTFQYCPIDDEGGQGALVTSSILLPVPSSADEPNIQNEGYTAVEEVAFSDDLSTNATTTSAGGPITFSEETGPSNGTLTVLGNGQFTYTSEVDFNGTDTFVYRATNAAGFSLATVTMTVQSANDSPVARVVAPIEVNDTVESLVINLVDSLYVSDVDGDTLTVTDVRIAPIMEDFRAPEEIFYDGDDLTEVSGNTLTVFPDILANIDDGDSATITVNYEVTDGEIATPIAQSLTIVINGVDNELGRQPGLYADSISERYNNHFKGFNEQGQGACLTCHLPGRVDVDVDFVRDCEQSPPVFNAYGLALCLDRSAGQGALTNLPERMANAEERFAPSLASISTPLQIEETAGTGDPIGLPLSVASTGQTIDGSTAEIVEFLLSRGSSQAPSSLDASGNFEISESGQLSVASGAELQPGSYSLFVLPVNDAGQKDQNGTVLEGLPGFYPAEGPAEITILVGAVPPEPAADLASTFTGEDIRLDVLANDGGGTAASLSLVAAPSNGSVTINSDLSLTYSPNPGFIGTENFSYTTSNSAGSAVSSASVTVSVLTEGALLAVEDTQGTAQGRETRIDVLANDFNVQRGGADATVVSLTSTLDASTEGSLVLDGQTVVLTTAEQASGSFTFTYSATNPSVTGDVGSEATVTVNVAELGGSVLSDAAISPELQEVARSFEMSCELVRDSGALDADAQAFLDVCVDLTLSASDLDLVEEAMQALRNEEHLAVVDATATVARSLGRVMGQRLSAIRDGAARGFNTNGVNLSIDGETLPTELVTQMARGFLGLGRENGAPPVWGLFVAGDFAWVDKDGSGTASDYELQSNNIMLGYDVVLNDRTTVGVSLGYSDTETDFSGGGSLDSHGYQLSAYGVQKDVFTEGLTLDGYASIGRMNFTSERLIAFGSVNEVAEAEFGGNYVNLAPRLSYSQVLGDYGDPIGALRTGTRLTWSASLDYLRLNVEEYTETGGGGLALNVRAQSYQSLLLSLGIDASRPIYLGPDITAELYGGLTMQGELLDSERSLTATFAAAGPNAPRFVVTEDGTQGLGGQARMGMRMRIGRNGQLDLSYTHGAQAGGVTSKSVAFSYGFEVIGNDSLSLGVTQDLNNSGPGQTTADLTYDLKF